MFLLVWGVFVGVGILLFFCCFFGVFLNVCCASLVFV